MKKVGSILCVLFIVAIAAWGFSMARSNGVTYEFKQNEFIEDYTEGNFSSTISKVVKNETGATKTEEFKELSVSQTYKCNVKLNQAQWRLIETTTGKGFTASYKFTAPAVSGTAEAETYSWAEFKPQMSKITGYIIKKDGGKEASKTYVEIVYPKKDPNNSKQCLGEVVFKNDTKKPAEKLS